MKTLNIEKESSKVNIAKEALETALARMVSLQQTVAQMQLTEECKKHLNYSKLLLTSHQMAECGSVVNGGVLTCLVWTTHIIYVCSG